MTTDIEAIDFAANLIAMYIDTMRDVAETRRANPGAFPGVGADMLTAGSIGRRCIAQMLNWGWVPPGDPVPIPLDWLARRQDRAS
jgi:hypothetical protein